MYTLFLTTQFLPHRLHDLDWHVLPARVQGSHQGQLRPFLVDSCQMPLISCSVTCARSHDEVL